MSKVIERFYGEITITFLAVIIGLISSTYGLIAIILIFIIWLIIIAVLNRDKIFSSIKKLMQSEKVKCECWDIIISGGWSFTEKNLGYVLSANSIHIANRGLPRKVKIKWHIESKYNDKLKDYEQIKSDRVIEREIPNGSNIIDTTGVFRLNILKDGPLEKLLKRKLSSNDFISRFELVNLRPYENCKSCNGSGYLARP